MINIFMVGPKAEPYMEETDTRYTRRGSRAIIEQDGKILFSLLKQRNQYLLPGGGIDAEESPEDCVCRECLEEVGMVVRPLQKLCIIEDAYEEYCFFNTYFTVDVLKTGLPTEFVPEEVALGLMPVWIDKDLVIEFLLSHEVDIPSGNKHRLAIQNSHYREACALSVYLGLQVPKIPQQLKTTVRRIYTTL